MKKLALVVAILLAALLVLQVTRRGTETPPRRSGQRLVSLAPNLTSLLFQLGCGQQLAGVTTYCNDPEEARQIEKIGDFLNPNLEKIVSLRPDLVLAEEWGSSRTVPRLRRLGVQVVELPSPQSVEQIYHLIREVGRLVEREEDASRLITQMIQAIEEIRARGRTFPFTPKLYLEIDTPRWTVGKPSFTSEAIEICGATNIFSELSAAAPQVSEEGIIQSDPDIIVSFMASREQVMARPGWQRISAVRHGRVIDGFNPDLLSRGNHRIVDGMTKLQEVIEKAMGF